jgi:hypothetical protein
VTRVTGFPTQTASSSQTTIEVYVSYCPTTLPAGALPRLGSNFSSPEYLVDAALQNGTDLNSTLSGLSSTNSTQPDDGIPLCKVCPESAGVCCPLDVECDHLKKCPWEAMKGMGCVTHGDFLVNGRNLSDGSMVPLDEQMPYSGDVEKNAKLLAAGEAERVGGKQGQHFAGASRFGGVEGQMNSGSGNSALGDAVEGERSNDGERSTRRALAKRERELKVGMFRDVRDEKREKAKRQEGSKKGWASGFVVGDDVQRS